MCGIVGFLDKRGGDRPIGQTLLTMLQALGCRGPDSAGVALFGPSAPCWVVQVKLPEGLEQARAALATLESLGGISPVLRHEATGAYVRLKLDAKQEPTAIDAEQAVLDNFPGSEVVSVGHQLEIVKQVGSPASLEADYGISRRLGSHGIGHTRLSTESRVDLSHSQPFWAHGVPDVATVHNGHITNYHKLRRHYEQQGHHFYTENDSEVIGVYLRDRLAAGLSLEDALRSSLDDFDGSFCYLAAWSEGLAYVKDSFGFKPLMLAETDDWVALATEEVALRQALGRDFVAREPAPGTMRVWKVPGLVPQAAEPLGDEPLTFAIDCSGKLTRAINAELRAAITAGETDLVVQAPDARHNLAVALLQPVRVVFDGSVGYYCGGLMDGATIEVRGSAGWGAAESMMNGTVVIDGNAGSGVAASIRGGTVVVRGDAAARAGVSMKGGTLLIGGNCGYMAGFMMQKGRIVVCGNAGDALADSMYEGAVFVGGSIEALGNDAVIEEPTADETAWLKEMLTRYDVAGPAAFKKVVSGRKLWNFDRKELAVWKAAL